MTIKLSRTLLALFAGIVSLSWLVAPSAAADRKLMVVGTAPAGSASFPYQVGISQIVNKYLPSFALSAQETGGSVANIRLLDENKIQLSGFAIDVAVDAVEGKKPFNKARKVYVLFGMYNQGFLWFAPTKSGIKSWHDLAGKKVIAGTPGGSTRVVGGLVAHITGVDKTGSVKFLPPNAMLSALQDGTVDAGFGLMTGAKPAPWVNEAISTMDLTVFGASDDVIAKVDAMRPGLTEASFPDGYLPKQKGITTIGEYLVMGASSNLSDDDAYNIVKTVYEHYSELGKYTPTVKGAKPETMVIKLPKGVSYQPGALRFFKEKGLIK
jgi:uncharacterized protein